MPTTTATTVRDIALAEPASLRVFEQYGIDYCCGGRRPLEEACVARNVSPADVMAAIEAASNAAPEPAVNWQNASFEDLIAHINDTHHVYLRRELPRLKELASKVIAKHGTKHPEVAVAGSILAQLSDELLDHLMKEEVVLFPYILQMERSKQHKDAAPHACFASVSQPINMMLFEHDTAGDALAKLRQVTSSYALPADACPTFHAFYLGLQELEQDLHLHIHKENNILFPRAEALETSNR